LDVIALWDADQRPPDPRYLFGAHLSYLPSGGRRASFLHRVFRLLQERRYDVVLSALVGLSPSLFLPSIRNSSTRRVTFIYGIDAWSRLPVHKRLALHHSDLVISNSQYTANRAAGANALEPSRVKLLYGCLDPELDVEAGGPSAGSAHPDVTLAGRTIVTVSRLARGEDKGHVAVLRALPGILRRVPDLHYVVIGDGNFRGQLEAVALRLGVAQRTHFVGAVSDAEVAAYLDTCDAFVMPSRMEGFGFVFLEALAHGLPVIAGVHDAAPEVLGPDAGLLVDPDNVPQLVDAIVRVLLDSTLRRRLIAHGRERLETRFRYPSFRDTLLSHLTTV
jgi:glycosyltransferase involved in cell wall biosynthesis